MLLFRTFVFASPRRFLFNRLELFFMLLNCSPKIGLELPRQLALLRNVASNYSNALQFFSNY